MGDMGRRHKGVDPATCACGGKHHAKGLCLRCYSRAKRVPKPRPVKGPCACGAKHFAKGLCVTCYNRTLRRKLAGWTDADAAPRQVPKVNVCQCGKLVTGRRMCNACIYAARKPPKPSDIACACGEPARIKGKCKACYDRDYYRANAAIRAARRAAKRPRCTGGKLHEWTTKGRCLRCGVTKC